MRASFEINAVLWEQKAILIIDRADIDETMSITNDAEAVVDFLNGSYPGFRIFYRDTMDNWDELVHDNGVFQRFNPGCPYLENKR